MYRYLSVYLAFSWYSLLILFPTQPFLCLLKIFYRVVADIAPGEELLLFMKSEDYPHETMAPDIHG